MTQFSFLYFEKSVIRPIPAHQLQTVAVLLLQQQQWRIPVTVRVQLQKREKQKKLLCLQLSRWDNKYSHTLTYHHFLFILLLGIIGKYLMIMRLVDFC